jgi:predicted DNA-binding transcriptional regulator YafY
MATSSVAEEYPGIYVKECHNSHIRPAGFDLAAYWKSSMEELRKSRPRYEATLLLEEAATEKLKLWRTASPAESANGAREAGWVTLRVQFDGEEQARFVALGFGPRVEVIEPESLRTRVTSGLGESSVRYRNRASR